MQIKKAGAVAFGALATVAVIGAPAAASAHTTEAKAQSMREVASPFLGAARDMWQAPWDGPQQSLVSAGTGSVANAAAWQICASNVVAGVGGVINSSSPTTVLDGCTNANIWLKQDTVPPVIGALNDTAIAAASWQFCGSNGVAGVGGTVALQTPATVLGGCDNSNIVISGPDGNYTEAGTVATARTKPTAQQKAAFKAAKQQAKQQRVAAKRQQLAAKLAGVGGDQTDVVRAAFSARKDALLNKKMHVVRTAAASPKAGMGWGAPWDVEPQSLATVGDGSAVQAASWQVCASNVVAGVGGTVVSSSPDAIFGDCRNATVKITQDDPTSVISVLDNTSINVAPWQICGSNSVAGVGGTVALQSSTTVFGACHNADTIID
ncbi:MAG: hypothetical protein HOV78_25750 [Hamadaea sp.]|nr:hypothetical protein [Hamadaea sp.]NUT06194.1 hypothetical protein [Hamadaea sp.]